MSEFWDEIKWHVARCTGLYVLINGLLLWAGLPLLWLLVILGAIGLFFVLGAIGALLEEVWDDPEDYPVFDGLIIINCVLIFGLWWLMEDLRGAVYIYWRNLIGKLTRRW